MYSLNHKDEDNVIVSFNLEDDSKLLKIENIQWVCNELLDNDLGNHLFFANRGAKKPNISKAFTNTISEGELICMSTSTKEKEVLNLLNSLKLEI